MLYYLIFFKDILSAVDWIWWVLELRGSFSKTSVVNLTQVVLKLEKVRKDLMQWKQSWISDWWKLQPQYVVHKGSFKFQEILFPFIIELVKVMLL